MPLLSTVIASPSFLPGSLWAFYSGCFRAGLTAIFGASVFYGREYEEKKERKKKTKEQSEVLTMAMKTVLKQPEKNAQRNPGERGWACYYCGKEGSLKRNCLHASKQPPAPCPVCQGPHWKTDCPQRHRSQGSDSQDNQD